MCVSFYSIFYLYFYLYSVVSTVFVCFPVCAGFPHGVNSKRIIQGENCQRMNEILMSRVAGEQGQAFYFSFLHVAFSVVSLTYPVVY